ncbi:YtpI family protein [Virgibacillus alimentarius]|uniref:Abi (CAAX) family protease n=1 Tax=Virgibacillus alimentarius TaxID=698769 RepID=A0ABS4SAL6_9BACI|nr:MULTISPECIES: YtpI family protein [Virgibacillus]MBP2258553.1 putative Abi (CAAX) family protease [Virgibacillus alimentarius]HLR68454.1 YtpI family protein [Virgibacillus sp.]
MIIFPIIIVLSIVFYVYYKVAIVKSKDPLTQAYFNAKSRICLGSFVFFFGINQYLFYQTRFSLFIGIVFLILGGMQLITGLKETKHYQKEWKRLNA